jgi:hypothetical protein
MEGIGSWTNFLTAAAGVTSALTGLVFIALSINLTHIMRLPGVSGRAGEAILILTTMLIGSLVALLPNLTPVRLGVTFLALGLATWGVPSALQLRAFVRRRYHRSNFAIWRFLLHQLATVPLMLAGLSLCGYFAGGLLWFAVAVILAIMVTLNNAWVLLVEILR